MYIKETYGHKPSCSVWKTMTKCGYVKRMARAYEIFFPTNANIVSTIVINSEHPHKKRDYLARMREAFAAVTTPGDPQVVADIGCGPWSGIFFLKQYPTMYGVEPVWNTYGEKMLTKEVPAVTRVPEYAESFKLPQPADLIFCINALNHGGCLWNSLQNMMDNLKVGGLLCMHLHMRTPSECDRGHPMPILKEELDEFFSKYVVTKKEICPDPLRPGRPGRPTYIVMAQNNAS